MGRGGYVQPEGMNVLKELEKQRAATADAYGKKIEKLDTEIRTLEERKKNLSAEITESIAVSLLETKRLRDEATANVKETERLKDEANSLLAEARYGNAKLAHGKAEFDQLVLDKTAVFTKKEEDLARQELSVLKAEAYWSRMSADAQNKNDQLDLKLKQNEEKQRDLNEKIVRAQQIINANEQKQEELAAKEQEVTKALEDAKAARAGYELLSQALENEKSGLADIKAGLDAREADLVKREEAIKDEKRTVQVNNIKVESKLSDLKKQQELYAAQIEEFRSLKQTIDELIAKKESENVTR